MGTTEGDEMVDETQGCSEACEYCTERGIGSLGCGKGHDHSGGHFCRGHFDKEHTPTSEDGHHYPV
jgi:hypothetical protein